MIKSALCLHGFVGSIAGKSGTTIIDAEIVLKLAYKHWKKYIIKHNNLDIFIHCWNVELQDLILKLFKPISAKFNNQITFLIPEIIPGLEQRKHSHYSRWYSFYKVNELKCKYEEQNNFKYDYVMNARFDIAWQKPIFFNKLLIDNFYINRLVLR